MRCISLGNFVRNGVFNKQFDNGSKGRGERVEVRVAESKSCVRRWKGKKTYDNKTREHTGGVEGQHFCTSMLNRFK